MSRKYSIFLENLNSFFSYFFLTITTFSHFFFLNVIPLLISLLVLYTSKSKKITKSINIILSTFILVVVQIDTVIFSQFRYHISPIVLKMVFGKRASDIFQFSAINVILFIAIIIGLLLMQFIFYFLATKIINKKINLHAKATVVLFLATTIISNCIYAWSDANYFQPVTQFKNVFPLYFPLTDDDIIANLGLVDKEKVNTNSKLSSDFKFNTIEYPLNPITAEKNYSKKNILFLIIDTWRFNSMSNSITPNIYQFSKNCQVFNNHLSGSNMTTGGVFSLFYGIPATYFDTFTTQEIAPVFMSELQKQDYEMLIYGSSGLENPPFNRNVFCKIPNLRLHSKGEKPSDRDLDITTEWMNKMNNYSFEKPFFGFLFFDSAHGYDFPKNYHLQFKPSLNEVNYLELDNNYNPLPLYNRYLNSVHYVDELIGKIINQLKEKGILNNTIIVISGDHGQEFNDNKKGYWAHGGNFSKFQTQTPLLIFDANKQYKSYNHKTIHYDIIPTLMKDYLKVKNNFNDYSYGQYLYNINQRDYFICGYNQRFAILEDKKIINIYPSGIFDITDDKLKSINDDNINFNIISKGMNEVNRFYKKTSNKDILE